MNVVVTVKMSRLLSIKAPKLCELLVDGSRGSGHESLGVMPASRIDSVASCRDPARTESPYQGALPLQNTGGNVGRVELLREVDVEPGRNAIRVCDGSSTLGVVHEHHGGGARRGSDSEALENRISIRSAASPVVGVQDDQRAQTHLGFTNVTAQYARREAEMRTSCV